MAPILVNKRNIRLKHIIIFNIIISSLIRVLLLLKLGRRLKKRCYSNTRNYETVKSQPLTLILKIFHILGNININIASVPSIICQLSMVLKIAFSTLLSINMKSFILKGQSSTKDHHSNNFQWPKDLDAYFTKFQGNLFSYVFIF